MTTPILFADFENLIPVIVSIIGIVIYAINQMFEKEKQQANQRRARAQQAARAPQPQHGGGGAGGGDPVDQFLREVAQLRGAPEQPRRDVQVVRPQQQRQRSSQQQRPAQQRQPQRSRRDTAAGQQRRSQTVVQPPQRQDSLASRSMEFNSRVSQAVSTADVDSKIDDHVEQVFDHQVGSLSGESVFGSEQAHTTTGSIYASLFANPANIRQAIIMQEIMTRPEERWGD